MPTKRTSTRPLKKAGDESKTEMAPLPDSSLDPVKAIPDPLTKKKRRTASPTVILRAESAPKKSVKKIQKDIEIEPDDFEMDDDELSEDPSDAGPEEEEEPDEEEIASSLPISAKTRGRPHQKIIEADGDIPDSQVSAVSPRDPLRRYLDEVRRYPLLEPEEEFRLATRLKESGDMEAARTLVSANLRLVVKIAFEYGNIYANLLDLIQEGNIGLMKAVSKFDPTKGARLGYYSSWWIRSYILKYLLDNFRLVKVGTTQAQKKLFYHLMREKERLEAQGLLAGPKLLAERLDVKEKDVIEMEQRLSSKGSEMSLDAPLDSESGSASYMDLLTDSAERADDALVRNQLLNLLKDRLPEFQKILNEKELKILQDRLLAEDPKTLQEVADHYGLTRERARQIETKVIQKLREYLEPLFGNRAESH